jgi:exopolysaccharide biosynthesis polyprenyl glycosylphosphotransferase
MLMTELPTSTVWTWSKAGVAAVCLSVAVWATAGFERSAWPAAVLAGVSLAVLGRLLAISKERRGASSQGVLILGASAMAARLIEEMETSDHRFRLIGAVDDSADSTPAPGVTPILGRLDQFAHVVAATRPGRIVIAMSDRRGRVPDRTLLESRFSGVLVEEAVDFFERVTGKLAIEAMRPSSLILSGGFGHSEFTRSRFFRALRGAGCRLAALAGLIVTSPLLVLIAIAIKLDSPGPIFFVQDRVGRGGRPFGLVKFRTMRNDAGQRTSEWVSDNTSRITRVGRWLRRFRLDELPQLANVVHGEMNIVGPRPHPVSNYELFLRHIPYYEFRSLVRPGLTGWAQVRYGYANDLEEETEKMRYDFYYIKHRSLFLDLRIILETFGVLLFDRRSHQAAKPRVAPDRVPDLNAVS